MATVIDLCALIVVGWSMASPMRTSLIIDALEMVRDHGHIDETSVVFQSVRGAQYTSGTFQKSCVAITVTQLMGAAYVCRNDGVAEFFSCT